MKTSLPPTTEPGDVAGVVSEPTLDALQAENAALKAQLATHADDREVERLMTAAGLTRAQALGNIRRKAAFAQVRAGQQGMSGLEIVRAASIR